MTKRLILHSNSLLGRGDVLNAINIIKALQSTSDVDCLILSPSSKGFINPNVLTYIKDIGFNVNLYNSQEELVGFANKFKASHIYYMKAGRYDGSYLDGVPGFVHAVFNHFEPHGEVYSYVSKWLYDNVNKSPSMFHWMSSYPKWKMLQYRSGSNYFPDLKKKVQWLAHPVVVSNPSKLNVREKFNIPDSGKIITRFGGSGQFSDPAGPSAIKTLLEKRKDLFFLLWNVKEFTDHERVIFCNEYISESDKAAIILESSLMLNCRLMGESFGFSVCESLAMGRPILAPSLERNPKMDANHIDLLQPYDLLYNNVNDLVEKVEKNLDIEANPDDLKTAVNKFSPQIFSRRFHEIFLNIY